MAQLESLDKNTCQVDQNIRHALGIAGRGAYGAFVDLYSVAGRPVAFPFVRPRTLVLSLHRPSWLDSEKNICVLHPNNIRQLGVTEGEYAVVHTASIDEREQWRIRKCTVRVFGGCGLGIARGGDVTEYPKIDEVYLDLDLRNALCIPAEAYNVPVVVFPAVYRLFLSRLLYYGIALFLAMLALAPIIQEAVSAVGLSKIFGFAATIALATLVTFVLCLFDIRARVQY